MTKKSLGIAITRFSISKEKTTELRYALARSSETKSKSILIIPALGVPASYYDNFLHALAQSGISSAVVDLQGQGKSSVTANRKSDFGYVNLINEDVRSALLVAATILPGSLILFGHSLGGQLLCLYLSKTQETHHSLILMTSCSVHYKNWPTWSDRLKVLLGTQVSPLIAALLGYFPGNRVGFGGRTGLTLIKDWSQQARTGKYRLLGSNFDWEKALGQLSINILSISIDGDFLAPHRATDHLNKKLARAKICRVHLCEDQYSHFNWVKNPNLVIKRIEEWMCTRQYDHT